MIENTVNFSRTTKNKIMYSKKFKDLVDIAVKGSDLYGDPNRPNPYFIGFGNPNSKILIVGKEKNIENKEAIKLESTQNPYQWKKMIEDGIQDIDFVFDINGNFKNPLHPYSGKPDKRNTCNQYQKLLEMIYPTLSKAEINNSFLLKSFITEVNHEISSTSLGNQKHELRASFACHDFFKNFPVIILAAADYLDKEEIEKRYNVKYQTNTSQSRRRYVLYKNENQNRVLINTRQMSILLLSTNEKEDYFTKIVEEVLKYNI